MQDKKKDFGVDIVRNGLIEAVHDDDIVTLLTSLGVVDKFNNGECKCCFCETTINLSNFTAIFPNELEICFCCDDPKCYTKLI